MEQLLTLLKNNVTATVVLFFIGAGILFLFCYDWNAIRRKAKRAKPITSDKFLQDWDQYRQTDKPGCYIILIYKRHPFKRTVQRNKRYSDVYIGQSVNMHKRVYNHITGHGNGDVYADVKYGKYVYIKFIPCSSAQLNAYEKGLIIEFDATESYNRTKGGAKLTTR